MSSRLACCPVRVQKKVHAGLETGDPPLGESLKHTMCRAYLTLVTFATDSVCGKILPSVINYKGSEFRTTQHVHFPHTVHTFTQINHNFIL